MYAPNEAAQLATRKTVDHVAAIFAALTDKASLLLFYRKREGNGTAVLGSSVGLQSSDNLGNGLIVIGGSTIPVGSRPFRLTLIKQHPTG